MRSFRILAPGLLVAGALLILPTRPAARVADPTLSSSWRTVDVTIDGSTGDWLKLNSLERGPAIAIQNDADYLYLAVATSDPMTMGATGELESRGRVQRSVRLVGSKAWNT